MVGFGFAACGDNDGDDTKDKGPEFSAVHYTITNDTHAALDVNPKGKDWFSDNGAGALKFVKEAEGSSLVGEKSGSKNEVKSFLASALSGIASEADIDGELNVLKAGQASGYWPSGKNLFVRVIRNL